MKIEKPDPKRAQLWLGYSFSKLTGEEFWRLRILTPQGGSYWICDGSDDLPALDDYRMSQTYCCWEDSYPYMITNLSMSTRVKRMRAYDKKYGRKTMFLANL